MFHAPIARFAAVALLTAAAGASAAVTIDPSTTYQTIEGIGVAPGVPTLFQKAGKFYQDRPTSYEYDRMCIDLGVSGNRFQVPTEMSYIAPGKYDWMGIRPYVEFVRACKARGVDRYVITILNPPGWAKTNDDIANGGNLKPAEYDGLADYMAQMCKAFKDSVGVEPYGLCVQNEPAFAEPYGSCIYSDADLSRLSSLTKQRLTPLGLTTRLFAASDPCPMGLDWPACQQNPDIYAFAIHNKCDSWDAAAGYAKAGNKRAWMTEWDIFPSQWTAGLKSTDYLTPAGSLLNALKAGFTYWTWFSYSSNLGSGRHDTTTWLDSMWVPDKRYYGTKMLTSFIRRDAVRIGCSGNSGAIAFKNPDNTISVIFVNSGGAATESIGGSGLPTSWHVYRTSATENCVYVGQSDGSNISLPAASVVSATSGSKLPELPADTIPYRVAAPTPDMTVGKISARGDDLLRVWVNGLELPVTAGAGDFGPNSVRNMVSLVKGDNVVACWIRNVAWGGGLLASMMLPGDDTLHSDGTWKVSVVDPTKNAAWNTTGFDDNGWKNAFAVGDVMSWPGFPKWGSQAVSLYHQGAQCILGGDHVYFRKVITFKDAATGIYVRGNNFRYKMYIDGNLVKEGSEFAVCKGGNRCFMETKVTVPFTFAQGTTHCIAYDIEDAAKDGNGVLMKAGYGRQSPPVPVPMDSTWWCSDNAPAGWNTVAYTDTATWQHPRVIEAYDPGSGVGKFIFPGDFWFRRKFTSKEGMQVMTLIGSLLKRDAVVSVKYFTLQGRTVKGGLRVLPGLQTMLIERRTYRSGRVEDVKATRTARVAR